MVRSTKAELLIVFDSLLVRGIPPCWESGSVYVVVFAPIRASMFELELAGKFHRSYDPDASAGC